MGPGWKVRSTPCIYDVCEDILFIMQTQYERENESSLLGEGHKDAQHVELVWQ